MKNIFIFIVVILFISAVVIIFLDNNEIILTAPDTIKQQNKTNNLVVQVSNNKGDAVAGASVKFAFMDPINHALNHGSITHTTDSLGKTVFENYCVPFYSDYAQILQTDNSRRAYETGFK